MENPQKLSVHEVRSGYEIHAIVKSPGSLHAERVRFRLAAETVI